KLRSAPAPDTGDKTCPARPRLGLLGARCRRTPANAPPRQRPKKRPGGPRSVWAPRRVREVGAQFPDRQGRVSPSHALSKPQSTCSAQAARQTPELLTVAPLTNAE